MTIFAFLRSAGAILAGMALLSLLETLLPFVRKADWRRRHRLPNLSLVALTLSLNFAFNAGAVLVSVWLGGARRSGCSRARRSRLSRCCCWASSSWTPPPGRAIGCCTGCRRSGASIASTTRTRWWT